MLRNLLRSQSPGHRTQEPSLSTPEAIRLLPGWEGKQLELPCNWVRQGISHVTRSRPLWPARGLTAGG